MKVVVKCFIYINFRYFLVKKADASSENEKFCKPEIYWKVLQVEIVEQPLCCSKGKKNLWLMQDMNIVQHWQFCFSKVLMWANLSQEIKMIWNLKEKVVSEYELRIVVKLTELRLFCDNELKVCKSLFFSSALK